MFGRSGLTTPDNTIGIKDAAVPGTPFAVRWFTWEDGNVRALCLESRHSLCVSALIKKKSSEGFSDKASNEK